MSEFKSYLFRCMPVDLVQALNNVNFDKLEEIRIRAGRPVILKIGLNEIVLKYIAKTEDILNMLQFFCNNSIYTYQNQISKGFITLPGGNRVGISGSVVIKDGKVTNINNIYSLNIRIARQIKDSSNNIISHVLNTAENSIYNTLIVSPPGMGKTTILKDLARRISTGIPEINFKGIAVTIIDERNEIAAMYKGIPQNDIGIRTDVLDNIPKPVGIKMAVRTLSPKVIVADEIGSKNDSEAIIYAVCSGVKGVFTAHGRSLNDLKINPELNALINSGVFEKIIFLDEVNKGYIKSVI